MLNLVSIYLKISIAVCSLIAVFSLLANDPYAFAFGLIGANGALISAAFLSVAKKLLTNVVEISQNIAWAVSNMPQVAEGDAVAPDAEDLL